MPVLRYELGDMANNTYLIVDEKTKEAALVDPSFDSEELWPEIQSAGYNVRYILNTHAHFDHIVGNAFYVAQTGAPLALHRADLPLLRALPEQGRMFGIRLEPSPDPTLWLEDEQTLLLGESVIRVLFTPGHSPGGVTFLVDDSGDSANARTAIERSGTAIVGDCLFAGSIGRTDLPGASLQTLLHSIRSRLLTLPDETRVLPGHNEPTTIGRERRTNPFLEE